VHPFRSKMQSYVPRGEVYFLVSKSYQYMQLFDDSFFSMEVIILYGLR
jgi:hypothetical protein